jgi:hypothetical protein
MEICGSRVQRGVEGQSLTAEDQLLILTQAGVYLTAMRGFGAPEVRICYERVESLCYSLNRPLLLYSVLMGQWLFSLVTGKLTATMQIANRVYSLAQEENDAALTPIFHRPIQIASLIFSNRQIMSYFRWVDGDVGL